ncbi:mannosyl-oligosaccharide alpha-1,2-mannosidase [Blastomyces parvus]|uniref:Mannosyl-oligosaccharide alpha-1,2-mannosidase n=1 Tax=Blastomyces parvus TaxID=2060905 RepID=A0A2B7X0Y8_9EURO|nr:mannosyl-oligosaccharide alpha-1,2-mannosidase [Blastomyces parvus]
MESFDNVTRPLKTLLESEEQGSVDGIIPEPTRPASCDIDTQDTKQNGTTTPFQEHSVNHDPTDHVPIFDEDTDVGDEEPNVAESFERTSSPSTGPQRSRHFLDGKIGDDWVSRMHKFSLYETSTRYYMVGMDLLEQRFRILKIERTAELDDLNISEDDTVYTKSEMNQLLDAVDDGNKSSGGLKLRCSSWGLLGFIKFTGPYYMLLVTRRSQVAMIGGHYVYQIDGTELVPLTSTASARTKSEKSAEEARFIAIMSNVDLTRSFYFSYSYNITRTLQRNISYEREKLQKGVSDGRDVDHNTMFVWNYYMLEPVVSLFKNAFDWCLPIIHGYVDQSMISVYGRLVYVTIIARRSRFFAGARFLKRGANDLGYVANDVETEQIVSEMLTTSFHSPGPKLYANPQYTSYVQHRGSIPLHWTQDSTGVSPKPDIELNLVDPFYSAAALHFNNLFERYGAPVYVLNLIKARERVPRESKLLTEFTNAITYLNQFLPEDKKILYKAWDMSRASKSHDQDVIGTLENIAEDIIPKTGFFRNGKDVESGLQLQNGIARTNCIDCLDRTNAAQFVIGKRALGYQLHALGIIDEVSVEYDTDAMNLFTTMWHHHGDTIAVQYGGSHLVNTMATYRKINQWTGHSRDMVESFKRYYNNSFLDAQRQEAYNLFLGNYIFSHGQPMLWELATDYYLHHSNPRVRSNNYNYINWFNPEFLKPHPTPSAVVPQGVKKPQVNNYDDYWLEYYRPLAVSSFSKIFSNKMKSTIRYLPFRSIQGVQYDFSPFVVRAVNEPDGREKKPSRRKGVTIQEPSDLQSEDARSMSSYIDSSAVSKPIQEWLQQPPSAEKHPPQAGIMKTSRFEPSDSPENYMANNSHTPSKAQLIQWSLDELVYESLHPSISAVEAEEYERYINHPLKVPLVVTSEDTLAAASLAERGSNLDLFEYANKFTLDDANLDLLAEDNLPDYLEFVNVSEEGLTVIAEDHDKKRYKRYRQWLRGKSLFKQRLDS